VLVQHVALVGEHLGRPTEVGAVGVLRDRAQRQLLATATDPDRRMRLLERLRVALGPTDVVVVALERGLALGPHRPHDLHGLVEHPDPVLRLREVVPVRPVLLLVPAGADTPVEAPTRHHVDVGRDLREQCRAAVAVAPDHLAEPDRRGELADRSDRGPALEHRLLGGPGHVVEVVVHPERVESEPLGELGDLDGLGPLGLGAVDRDQVHLPALGHEHPEHDVAFRHGRAP
jgi:hypothetical protein